MGEVTKIQWTDHTFNPWIGCARVSPGCEHCYAETQANFRKAWGVTWGVHGNRSVTSLANWRKPLSWDRAARAEGRRHRVFCASLADVFEDRPELHEPRERLWKLVADTPGLDWLLLSKRPENFRRMLPWVGSSPWPNIWLGVTAEDQMRANERIPLLLDTPAAVRFVSYEPALARVDFGKWMPNLEGVARGRDFIDWIIVGGESGPMARPFDIAWAHSVVHQCAAAGVACFVKQLGERVHWSGISFPGEHWPAGTRTRPGQGFFRVHVPDKKGSEPEQWPESLRVRQWPESRP